MEKIQVEEKVRSVAKSLYAAGRVAVVLVLAYIGLRVVLFLYREVKMAALETLDSYVSKQVEGYEIVMDVKKGTVQKIGELEKDVLARKLFTTAVQHRNCMEAMENIYAESSNFRGVTE
jgi:hypothetical protein